MNRFAGSPPTASGGADAAGSQSDGLAAMPDMARLLLKPADVRGTSVLP